MVKVPSTKISVVNDKQQPVPYQLVQSETGATYDLHIKVDLPPLGASPLATGNSHPAVFASVLLMNELIVAVCLMPYVGYSTYFLVPASQASAEALSLRRKLGAGDTYVIGNEYLNVQFDSKGVGSIQVKNGGPSMQVQQAYMEYTHQYHGPQPFSNHSMQYSGPSVAGSVTAWIWSSRGQRLFLLVSFDLCVSFLHRFDWVAFTSIRSLHFPYQRHPA